MTAHSRHSSFLEKPKANRVNRFIKVRTVRFDRSTWLVHIVRCWPVEGSVDSRGIYGQEPLQAVLPAKFVSIDIARSPDRSSIKMVHVNVLGLKLNN